jgi:hypothetical protein
MIASQHQQNEPLSNSSSHGQDQQPENNNPAGAAQETEYGMKHELRDLVPDRNSTSCSSSCSSDGEHEQQGCGEGEQKAPAPPCSHNKGSSSRSKGSRAKFHDLYLQKGGIAFLSPILFEDGMDYVECRQYYDSIQSQHARSGTNDLRSKQQRRTSLRELEHLVADCNSSVRRSRRNDRQKTELNGTLRRCSFSGLTESFDMNNSGDSGMPNTLVRSSSQRDLIESTPHVRFEECVQVVTIYSAVDYPPNVRTNIWMSRKEMSLCMRRALAEKVAQQKKKKAKELARQEAAQQAELQREQAQEEAQKQRALLELREQQRELQTELLLEQQQQKEMVDRQTKDLVIRQNSVNSVVSEFIQSSKIIEN